MAKLVVIDGPEKAGKTTLILSLVEALEARGQDVMRFHWSTPDPKTFHSFIYRDSLSEAFKSNKDVIIWDRSWVSEYVYPGLLPHMRSNNRTTWADPWISEWCFGRAIQTYGVGMILLGPSVERLEQLRDGTDLPCPVFAERERFRYYGNKFGWCTIENQHSSASDDFIVQQILTHLQAVDDAMPDWLKPPIYCGPTNAKVVFMGEQTSPLMTRQTWLPFSSKYTTQLGREFGDQAFNFGWTNTNALAGVTTNTVQDFFIGKLVVACGEDAADYCKTNELDYYRISHPSYGFRWGQAVEEYKSAIELLKIKLAGRGVYQYGESEAKDKHSTGTQSGS